MMQVLVPSTRRALSQLMAARLQSTSSTPASSAAGQPSTSAASSSAGVAAGSSIYTACVLERLPIVESAAPQWEVEHNLWLRAENLRDGFAKEYPKPPAKKDGQGGGQMKQDLREFSPVPIVTADDAASNFRSMKRRLEQRLFMLVKRRPLAGEPGAPSSGSQAVWQFPVVQHKEGESLREAGERALTSVVGRAHPIYFIGNAPMAHLSSTPVGGSTFYMLSQVVGGPWTVQLKKESGCEDVAWVTKEELPLFLQDARLNDLAARML